MTTTAAQIKRRIGDMLVVAEHNGRLWATNRYWACPLIRLMPFTTQHGIGAPGVWDIGKHITPREGSLPDLTATLSGFLDLARYTVPLTPAYIGDDKPGWGITESRIYIRTDENNMAEVLTTPTGNHVAVPADLLDWLEEDETPWQDGAPVAEIALAATDKSLDREQSPGPVAIILRPVVPEDGGREHLLAVVMPTCSRMPTAEEAAEFV